MVNFKFLLRATTQSPNPLWAILREQCRLPQDDSYDKEEVLYVDNYLTEDYFKGKLLAGFEINDAKYFE